MKAEIISIGTELLLGDIVNTNSSYLARKLSELGIFCYHQATIGDNPERLKEQLIESMERADLIITTGGLGPTYDDLSKEMLAELAGCKMILNEEALQRMEVFFENYGQPMTENNLKQVYLPEGAHVFINEAGTAPGFALEVDGTIVIMLPGPPREMSQMFEDKVTPFLQKKSNTVLRSKVIHLFGIGESQLETRLDGYMQEMTNPTIAPYAKEGEVSLRVTSTSENEVDAFALIDDVIEQLEKMIGEYIYGIDVGNLETAFGEKFASLGGKLTLLELGNGGTLHHRLASIPGNEVFLESTSAIDMPLHIETFLNDGHRHKWLEIGEATDQDMVCCYTLNPNVLGEVHIAIKYQGQLHEATRNVNRGYKNDLARMRHVGASFAIHEMLQLLRK